jgi:hypothetical protein
MGNALVHPGETLSGAKGNSCGSPDRSTATSASAKSRLPHDQASANEIDERIAGALRASYDCKRSLSMTEVGDAERRGEPPE